MFYINESILKVVIQTQNIGGSDNSAGWFGRVFLSTNNNGTAPATPGGIIQIITDFRNPNTSSYNNNYITVSERWDNSGNNALRISINSFAGNITVKIS